MREKRQHRRVKTYIECIIFDNDNKEEISGFVTDLSAHGIGILIKGNHHLEVGKTYEMQCVKQFVFDKDYSFLVVEIKFTRFERAEDGIKSGAMIVNRLGCVIEDYIHKIDVENYMNVMRFTEYRKKEVNT